MIISWEDTNLKQWLALVEKSIAIALSLRPQFPVIALHLQ